MAAGDDDREALRRALEDPDENVRAHAAVRLAELGDPDALQACIRTLDDGAGPGHLDVTPAVGALAEFGDRALRALLVPLAADDDMTRLHAQRAVEQAIYRRHGFRPGQGFPSAADDQGAGEELRAIGYRYDAEPAAREAAIERLRRRLDDAPSPRS